MAFTNCKVVFTKHKRTHSSFTTSSSETFFTEDPQKCANAVRPFAIKYLFFALLYIAMIAMTNTTQRTMCTRPGN